MRSRGLPHSHLNTSNEFNGVRRQTVPPNLANRPGAGAGKPPCLQCGHRSRPRRPPTHAMLGDMPDVRDTRRRDKLRRSLAVGAGLVRQVAGLPLAGPSATPAYGRPTRAQRTRHRVRVKESGRRSSFPAFLPRPSRSCPMTHLPRACHPLKLSTAKSTPHKYFPQSDCEYFTSDCKKRFKSTLSLWLQWVTT